MLSLSLSTVSIIARTRRGYNSYTNYDLQIPDRHKAIKARITDIARDLKQATSIEKANDEIALLKFIYIALWQEGCRLRNNTLGDWFGSVAVPLINNVLNHVLNKLNGYAYIFNEELYNNPENLFTPPKYILYQSTPRKIVGYEKNETASLASEPTKLKPSTPDKVKAELETVTIKLESSERTLIKTEDFSDPQVVAVTQSKAEIQEHGRRRVELFFLLCLALYNTQRLITFGDTNKQHGKGTGELQACHSSLFPGITDQARDRGTRSSSHTTSIFENTFLKESFNSTVELPKCVNIFDRLLEGRNTEKGNHLRQILWPVLDQVSTGTLMPLEAMKQFFSIFDDFLNKNEKLKKDLEVSTKYSPSIARKCVKEYEEEGTFYWTDKTKRAASIQAVSCWLRISDSTAALFMHNASASPKRKVSEKIASIQHSFQSSLFQRYEHIKKEALMKNSI